MARYRIEYVEWIDPHSCDEGTWMEIKDVKKTLAKCRSVGWVILEDEDSITLANHLSNNDMVDGLLTIPKSLITKRKSIK